MPTVPANARGEGVMLGVIALAAVAWVALMVAAYLIDRFEDRRLVVA